jgi:hypothetical protein
MLLGKEQVDFSPRNRKMPWRNNIGMSGKKALTFQIFPDNSIRSFYGKAAF